MPTALDLRQQRFGRLTVLSRSGRNKHGSVTWRCLCDCGEETVVVAALLSAGRTQSCGCLQREAAARMGALSRKDNPYSRTKEYRSALRKRLRSRPEVAAAERISRMMCHALSAIGATKSGGTFEMLGYTPDDLRVHIERQFSHGMSWDNRGEWHIDHIIPVSTAESAEDVVALNQLSNLRPLWAKKNLRKHAKRTHLL